VLVQGDELAKLFHLQQFALDHLLSQIDEGVENAEIALLHCDFESLHVQPVACQHAFGDDIIDEAQNPPGTGQQPTRNGQPPNACWQATGCTLQAFKVAGRSAISDSRHLIDLTQQMVEGELLQMEKLGQLISLDEHFQFDIPQDRLSLSVCMRMGAILGGSYFRTEESLAQYRARPGDGIPDRGRRLDLTASQNVLGKLWPAICAKASHNAVIHALERVHGAVSASLI